MHSVEPRFADTFSDQYFMYWLLRYIYPQLRGLEQDMNNNAIFIMYNSHSNYYAYTTLHYNAILVKIYWNLIVRLLMKPIAKIQ